MSTAERLFPAVAPIAAVAAERESIAIATPQSEDARLMLRVQNGDETALGVLLERYAHAVLTIGLRILRDPGEAQELVQDVFLQIYQKRHLYDPGRGALREAPVCCIISDHMLQGRTGLELAKEMKRIKPDVPVILYSGNIPLLLDGIDVYVNKGETTEAFLKIVRERCDSGSAIASFLPLQAVSIGKTRKQGLKLKVSAKNFFPASPTPEKIPPKITMSLLSFGVTWAHTPIRPEHASVKSHVQTQETRCITTGAATRVRIVHYKEVSHDSENATASTPLLGEN